MSNNDEKKKRKIQAELYELEKRRGRLKKKLKTIEKGKKKEKLKETREQRRRRREEREKRKSDDSSSEQSEEEETVKEASKESRIVDEPIPALKQGKVIVRGVQVKHPDTGKLIKVSDASNRWNRGIWNIAQASFKEGVEGGTATKLLVNLIAQAMEKGMRFNDFTRIPEWVVHEAKLELRRKLGEEVFEETVNTDHVTTVESFHGSFQKNTLTYEEVPEWKEENRAADYVKDLQAAAGAVTTVLKKTVKDMGNHRCYIVWRCKLGKTVTRVLARPVEGERLDEEIQEMRVTAFSSSGETGRMEYVRKEADAEEAVERMNERLIDLMERYLEHGSGWQYFSTITVDIYNSKQLTRGSDLAKEGPILINKTGGAWLKLPFWCKSRRVCNPRPPEKAKDVRCFAWAILRGLYPKPKEKKGGYCLDLIDKVDTIALPQGIEYPIPIQDRVLRKIEELNPFSFSVYAIGEKEGEVTPVYVSSFRNQKRKHLILGLIKGQHFVLLPGLSQLFHRPSNRTHYYCENCLHSFKSHPRMEEHYLDCVGMNEPTRIRMPTVDGKDHGLKFMNWQYKLPAPFVIYADIEALLKQVEGLEDNVLSVHKPVAWAYKIICRYPEHEEEMGTNYQKLGEMRSYCGESSMLRLLEMLSEDAERIEAIVNTHLPYKEEKGDADAFREATACHVCLKEYAKGKEGLYYVPYDIKVLDHDHMTGKYRGAAHRSCNAQYSTCKYYRIPIVFHNLKNYDAFHILRGLKNYVGGVEKITCIAKNLDKFTSFTIDTLRFIDSFQFLFSSLESNIALIIKELKTKEQKFEKFAKVVQEFDLRTEEGLDLMLHKGIYPYEAMQNKGDLKATELPPKAAFFSELTGAGITEADYVRAHKVWELTKCETMADYTLVYVRLDVLLLSIIFEGFRESSLTEDGLDPVHFVTAPSLAWAAMLLMNFKNDHIIYNMTDLEMAMMVKRGIRGGMCQVFKPYARYRSQLDTKSGNENKVYYFDAVNLYGTAMTKYPLPYDDYRWEHNPEPTLDEECDVEELGVRLSEDACDVEQEKEKEKEREVEELDLTAFDWQTTSLHTQIQYIMSWGLDDKRGHILEVDIYCPVELHDKFNEYPLLPQQAVCYPSPYTVEQFNNIGMKMKEDGSSSPVKKLVCDLTPKTRYVIHYLNLQQAIHLGYVVTKIHRVFSFAQSRWMAEFIQTNTERRKVCKARGDVAGTAHNKLKNNSIYGKTVEDVEKRRNIKFFVGEDVEKAMEAASTPFVKAWKIVVEDELLVMELAKHKITLNRPTVIGFTVLECSKHHMYHFHYEQVKPYWGLNVQLLYTDTDSLVYKFKGLRGEVDKDIADFQRKTSSLDLSEVPKSHWLAGQKDLDINAGVLGMFKDENAWKRILSFIALRCKMYSQLIEGEDGTLKQVKKMKGIPSKATVEMTEEEQEKYMEEHQDTDWDEMTEKERSLKLTRRGIIHEDYERVFQGEKGKPVEFVVIRQFPVSSSKWKGVQGEETAWEPHEHVYKLQTAKITKRGLANTDDKSWYFNARESVRYGHYSISGQE